MNTSGLQFSVRSAGGGILLNTHVPQTVRKCEYSSARAASFQGQGLACRERVGPSEIRRPRYLKRFFASTGDYTQSSNVDSNGQGAKQAVLERSSAPDEQKASEDSKFNWSTQWYPIAVIKELDKNAPHAATIIGRPLAVWWDKSTNKWQVYADQCPHRLGPLSEGSISEDGLLRCSYHGWTFKGDSGECTEIPQAPKDGEALHASKRACASVYPSIEQQGIIWFWPDLSQGSVNMEAAANPPPAFSELSDPTFGYDMSYRDLEYSYETLIENLMDPSHVNFAHHKIQGNRKNAVPLNYKITSKITPSGFKGGDERSVGTFYPPCSFILQFAFGGKQRIHGTQIEVNPEGSSGEKAKDSKSIVLILLCIPVSPGKSRLIWSFPRNFATFLFKLTPPWITHMTNNLVLDSDLFLLHLLDRRLEHEGAGNWFQKCYAPTGADAYVHAFRKWLNEFAGGAPDWAGRFEHRLPPSLPKRIIMDRFTSHVVKCKSCSNALKNFKALEAGLQVLPIALVGLVAASAVVRFQPVANLSVPLVIGAVVATVCSRWLAHFIYKTFYFHDYNHAVVK